MIHISSVDVKPYGGVGKIVSVSNWKTLSLIKGFTRHQCDIIAGWQMVEFEVLLIVDGFLNQEGAMCDNIHGSIE